MILPSTDEESHDWLRWVEASRSRFLKTTAEAASIADLNHYNPSSYTARILSSSPVSSVGLEISSGATLSRLVVEKEHLFRLSLAEMIGTTRSRISFFMNRFRKLGFIHYNSGLQVHSSLLNVVLHDLPYSTSNASHWNSRAGSSDLCQSRMEGTQPSRSIVGSLGISLQTLRNHLHHVNDKLRTHNRLQPSYMPCIISLSERSLRGQATWAKSPCAVWYVVRSAARRFCPCPSIFPRGCSCRKPALSCRQHSKSKEPCQQLSCWQSAPSKSLSIWLPDTDWRYASTLAQNRQSRSLGDTHRSAEN